MEWLSKQYYWYEQNIVPSTPLSKYNKIRLNNTSPRATGDLKMSPKSRKQNRTCLISLRLPRDPPNL